MARCTKIMGISAWGHVFGKDRVAAGMLGCWDAGMLGCWDAGTLIDRAGKVLTILFAWANYLIKPHAAYSCCRRKIKIESTKITWRRTQFKFKLMQTTRNRRMTAQHVKAGR